jgi:hypothetical protein
MSTTNWADLIKKSGDAANTNYEPLPDGDYELKIVKVESVITSTGKPMYKVTNEVQGGPYANRKVWDNLVVTHDSPSAMNMFFMKVIAMGLTKPFFESNPTDAQIEQALTGRTFRANLGLRTYEGKDSNEIKRYYKGQETAAPSSTPGAAVPPPPPAPAPAPAPASPVSSETPF